MRWLGVNDEKQFASLSSALKDWLPTPCASFWRERKVVAEIKVMSDDTMLGSLFFFSVVAFKCAIT